ncbi:MAG: hypothetical protein V1869_03685 [Candidatus Omnitrophota bacterium]
MKKLALTVILLAPFLACFAQDVETNAAVRHKGQITQESVDKNNLSECEKAGGKLTKIKECDGSESSWCVISAKEQCYADQVENGKCSVGKYSEESKAIVGISPRVLCD